MLPIAVIFIALVALLYLSSRWVERKQACAETARKFIHLSLGVTALAFPWIFHHFWQVLLLCLASYALFLCAKFNQRIHQQLGLGLFSIKRTSRGELYFALSILFLAHFAHGNTLLYLLPLALLTFADTLAALVGKHHGKHRFRVLTTHKSWQGSSAFVLTALAISIPTLFYFTNLSAMAILLLALSLALMSALAEAVSWNGVDNLLIPLVSFLFLSQALPQPTTELATTPVEAELILKLSFQLGLTLSLVALAWSINKATKLSIHASLGGAFLLSLGSSFLLLS